jgi:hypothetical protein
MRHDCLPNPKLVYWSRQPGKWFKRQRAKFRGRNGSLPASGQPPERMRFERDIYLILHIIYR